MVKLSKLSAVPFFALSWMTDSTFAYDDVMVGSPLMIDAIVVRAADLSATWVPESPGGIELDMLRNPGTRLGSIKVSTTVPHDVIAISAYPELKHRDGTVLPVSASVRGNDHIEYAASGDKDLPNPTGGSTGWFVFESSEPNESIDFFTAGKANLKAGEYSAFIDVLVANK